ncbi:DUF3069 domain-containing protein [Photobacterium leiognathi]|uniref:DUF3069 domain-containing protein n=3 Tax=Photobacterium leiognathi TaxID=553611 RepID=V5H5G1_PHOLE|nr:DUF3069 domain-containing protein [Photobacterium leiognathi]KJF91830.1 hypothetical protein UB42_00715 [Photobacterium leiognathi]KJF97782.1 hypothetical protein UB34_11205 [Photobacterium leiognathi]MCG3886215.1 DUF3069 domain-containing protein [Photobacterium leiognathi]PHZ60460.1 DUF3069 domain-containing protein [Photobacterium leiognathi]PSV01290.1 DUF3069 domain-containing protein [Photobacterium leiognathi subsp. mandapamensis]
MSEMNNKDEQIVEEVTFTLEDCSPELRQVVKFEQVPAELIDMLVNVYKVSEPSTREAWNSLPASAQNVLDNFEQFHALVALSQSYSGVDFLSEMQGTTFPEDMDAEAQAEYKAAALDKVLHNCVKDMCKQLKKARQNPPMKREFTTIFQK